MGDTCLNELFSVFTVRQEPMARQWPPMILLLMSVAVPEQKVCFRNCNLFCLFIYFFGFNYDDFKVF